MALGLRRGGLVAALVAAAACVPVQRAGREDPSTAATASDPGDAGHDWNDWGGAGGDGGMSIPDGGARVADAAPAPPREVLASAPLAGGGTLVVEADEGGYAFVLDAAGAAGALALEPLGLLGGPEAASVYFGPGCRRVEAGRAAPLGRWTGDLRRCATSPRPAAVLDGSPARPGCPVAAVGPGTYTLTVWPCGSYGAPLAIVRFDVEAPAAAPGAGPDGSP